ncbi:MAG: hypothetical protein E4G94_05065 [ANME-2 cluster archaeon]|nr:MAG: hypothetical protein E4G94_05065 [ANME-2 cluster archaeon]
MAVLISCLTALRAVTPRSVSMNASHSPSSICLTTIPPPIDTAPLAITSLQPFSRMALGEGMHGAWSH